MVTEPKTPTFGKIWTIPPGAPNGTAPTFFATGPVAPEAIHFPTANACTVSINGVDIEYLASGYTIPPGNVSPELFSLPPFGAILGWTAAQMTPFIGKAIVPDESTGQIFAYNGPDLIPNTPDATSFSMTGYQLEGNTLVVCPPTRQGPCITASPGFWKTHPEAWPVDTVTIGGVVYTKAQAIALMSLPKGGDSRLIAFFQLVSYKLNVAAGTPDCKASTVALLDAFFVAHPLPASGPIGTAVKISSINALADILAAYNNDNKSPCGELLCPTGTN